MIEAIYREIKKIRDEGAKAVLATIITKLGSAPREKGAKLLVREDGSSLGTISGGCVEAEAWHEAIRVMKTGESKVIGFHLTEKDAVGSGLVCGGSIEVYLEPIWGDYDSKGGDIFEGIIRTLSQGSKAFLATVIQRTESSGKGKLLIKEDGYVQGSLGDPLLDRSIIEHIRAKKRNEAPVLLTIKDSLSRESEIYLEPITPTPVLFIFGGGHISLPLARMGKLVGFKVVVIDDRELYANKNRFPEVDEVYALEFEKFFEQVELPSTAYIVIVTRGHLYDELVLERVLKTEAVYIGMIGSKRKVKYTYESLHAKGITEEELSRVHSPIGLDIGAEMPEEIAVSILAELIKVRHEQ